jgi:catalase
VEQAHIVRAFRFELTKVQVLPIRQRVLSQLANVDMELARKVAEGLGLEVPKPQPAVQPRNMKPEVKVSPTLSLTARPGDGSIRTRCIAILVANGVVGAPLEALHRKLADEGAVPRFIGARLGTVRGADGRDLDVEVTLETAPSVLFDAVVIPDGEAGVRELAGIGHAVDFVKDQYRHCKTILVLGAGEQLLKAANITKGDAGLLKGADASKAAAGFIAAVAKHRHFERQTDPPMI